MYNFNNKYNKAHKPEKQIKCKIHHNIKCQFYYNEIKAMSNFTDEITNSKNDPYKKK